MNWLGMRQELLKGMSRYKDLIEESGNHNCFWDAIILTAGTEKQRDMYQSQIEAKLRRKEIPSCCKYLVFSDPPGAKLGDGGATLHALDQLVITESEEYIKNSKVLLIHAGGYSQRLPSASVIGKVFAAYPISKYLHL
jgi:fucose-1-phosphate guanylyltransferase